MKIKRIRDRDIGNIYKATLESTGKTIEMFYEDMLSPADPAQIYYGFDGELTGDENLTKEEKLEIADYMIERWHKWKRNLSNG